jgi:hypothetical protein
MIRRSFLLPAKSEYVWNLQTANGVSKDRYWHDLSDVAKKA